MKQLRRPENWERHFAVNWRNYKRYTPVSLQILIQERSLQEDLLQELKTAAVLSSKLYSIDREYKQVKNCGQRFFHHFLKNNLALRRKKNAGRVGNYESREEFYSEKVL
jgi:hypothetical protein